MWEYLWQHATNDHYQQTVTHENLLHGIFYFKQYLQFGAVMQVSFFGRMMYFIIHEQPTVVHFELILSYCLEDF